MAFKLKGFPKHGTKSGFPKVIKETGYKPEEQDDPTKKFRHDVKTREHDDGKTEEVHTFARGGRYDTEAKVVGKKGDKHFKDKDGDEVATIVYSPDKPLSCGARVWIETRNEIEIINKNE